MKKWIFIVGFGLFSCGNPPADCSEDSLQYTVTAKGVDGECLPCSINDTILFAVEVKNMATQACTVTRNNGCLANIVEIYFTDSHSLETTAAPMCTQAIEVDALEAGTSITGTVKLESSLVSGTYLAIAKFTDHHNGEASTLFELE